MFDNKTVFQILENKSKLLRVYDCNNEYIELLRDEGSFDNYQLVDDCFTAFPNNKKTFQK